MSLLNEILGMTKYEICRMVFSFPVSLETKGMIWVFWGNAWHLLIPCIRAPLYPIKVEVLWQEQATRPPSFSLNCRSTSCSKAPLEHWLSPVLHVAWALLGDQQLKPFKFKIKMFPGSKPVPEHQVLRRVKKQVPKSSMTGLQTTGSELASNFKCLSSESPGPL